MAYFSPALDPPLGESGRKTTTLVRNHEYFIHTKFHQNQSSASGEEVKNVNCLTTDGRKTHNQNTSLKLSAVEECINKLQAFCHHEIVCHTV